ncbi:hypothetical protein OsccyDRAFT_3497 [Leptolyngbyaceae cyanobacterium JSC-12]|nr:hypothetical protein OsccyDRAFT_3497 [Leptolyngbyaceae cyanobacterium JSC-12]
MPISPSGPYQSRILRTVVRQTRHLFERGQTTVRRVQMAANWSAQILLYPVYALFQTGRVIGRVLGQTAQGKLPSRQAPQEESYEIPLRGTATDITAETPVQNVLKTVQSLALPGHVPVWVREEVSIRAIASLLESKSLVLVTNHNQILDVLTPEQQYLLNQRIIYEVAVFGRQTRSWKLPLQRAQRFLRNAGSWAKASVSAVLPGGSNFSDRPLLAPPDADEPVKQCLLALREVMPATQTAILLPAATLHSTPLAYSQPQLPALPVHIRGVASLLSTQTLVLVTNQNESLDILTPQQQHLLHQRIAWEVAHYLRYLRSRNSQSGLAPLRPPSPRSLILPPVRAFQWLMAWMQSGTVAVSINLFQEATWDTCPLPSSPLATSVLPVSNTVRRSLKTLRQRLTTAQAQLSGNSAPSSLALPAAPPTVALSSFKQGASSMSYPGQICTGTIGEKQQRPLTTDASAGYVTVVHRFTEDLSTSDKSDRPEPPPDYIDTHVTLMHYEQSWLERIVHWLDRCLLWIEAFITSLWNGLKSRR